VEKPEDGGQDAGVVTVGIVANPASGRDVRRLTTGASVFDNAEKGSMVHRLLAGLGAAGVDRALLMPAGDGLLDSLRRHLRGRTGRLARQRLPELEILDLPLRGDARDTAAAVAEMCRQGASALVVLGGDGTARIVAEHCGDVPISALSTGTNNAFPEMREATVVGLAVGMLAAGRLDGAACTRTHKTLAVTVDGEATASALVDVAAVSDPFIGARALWRPEAITDVVVAFADPGVVGLAGLAGQVAPVARDAPYGLHLRLAEPSRADRVVTAALGPGLVVAVGVAAVARLQPGDEVSFDPAHASVALDGERELEVHPAQCVAVRLGAANLRTVDVDAVMREAAARGLLTEEAGE
jgi:predicted polyphosphate/ATP-dependent NAD kinase